MPRSLELVHLGARSDGAAIVVFGANHARALSPLQQSVKVCRPRQINCCVCRELNLERLPQRSRTRSSDHRGRCFGSPLPPEYLTDQYGCAGMRVQYTASSYKPRLSNSRARLNAKQRWQLLREFCDPSQPSRAGMEEALRPPDPTRDMAKIWGRIRQLRAYLRTQRQTYRVSSRCARRRETHFHTLQIEFSANVRSV